MSKPKRRKSDRFLAALESYDSVTIMGHTNPDPDAMASGWALCHLIEHTLHKPCRMIANGVIERAENKQMLNLLKVPITLTPEIEHHDNEAIILVDCGPSAANHLLATVKLKPTAVIDHHEYKLTKRQKKQIPFLDLRPSAAAAATITGSYLRDHGIDPPARLATALMYAMRTEIFGSPRRFSPLDQSVSRWISNFADFSLITRIENAPIQREYYGDLLLALQNTFIYEDAILCLLPRVQNPEIIGEIADLLIRCQGVHRVLCGGILEEDFLMSIRSHRPEHSSADLAREVLDGIGRSGGHQHRAGGRVADIQAMELSCVNWEAEIRSRWLKALDKDPQLRGIRLLAKREIVKNL